MKYLSVLLFLVISLGSIKSYGQNNENTRKISLKLYSQIITEAINPTNRISLGISPSVSVTNQRGHFHELELIDFSFHSDKKDALNNGFSKSVTKQFGLRYSFNYSINKKGKLKAFIGAGVNTNLSSYKHEYNYPGIMDVAQEGEYNAFTSSVSLNVTPRLVWNVSDKWFLDINIPVNAYSFSNTTEQTDDVDGKIKMNSSTSFPNKYTVNVGVGFRF